MKGVLVTGATTPVGAGVVQALLSDPTVGGVLAVGAEEAGLTFAVNGADRWGGRLRYLRADLTRSRQVRQLLFAPAREHDVEVVIHIAQHRGAHFSGARVHALNVESTREILQLCERHPTIRRFVLRSYAEVYRVRADQPSLLAEDHPLDVSPEHRQPQWLRDRIEADLLACSAMGLSPLCITVLRCAECLAPGTGSQLYDYLQSRVCFHPLGYDPMLNLISQSDLVQGILCAARAGEQGVFNLPGRDTLPLSAAISRWGRLSIGVPAGLMEPLYKARTAVRGGDFRYDLNQWRFHFSGVLDGRRARERLGYEPQTPVGWPR